MVKVAAYSIIEILEVLLIVNLFEDNYDFRLIYIYRTFQLLT